MEGQQQMFGQPVMAQQMQTTTQEPDYGKINEELSSGTFFKPKAGVPYEVLFIDGGGPIYEKAFKVGDAAKKRQDFKVKVRGGEYAEKELTWTQTIGGKDSLYGKLTALFGAWQKSGKTVRGSLIHIGCTGDGKDRKYQIIEYNNLQTQMLFAGQQTAK